MKKWLIRWNPGYGDHHTVVEAETREIAENTAYEAWRKDVESYADYSAEEATSENANDAGLDPEDYGLPAIEYE